MVTAKKEDLKQYPFHDGSVNENGAVRVVRMVIPFCSADPNPEIIRRDGTTVANPNYTGEENCQQKYKFNDFGRWDVEKCMSLGHDPYHTTFRRTVVEEEVDENGYVVGKRERVKVEKRLNITQVPLGVRHTTGNMVALRAARGAKFLEDFGFASPCEMRSCSRPQSIVTRYGKFCSERHARLIAADVRSLVLNIGSGGDPFRDDDNANEREEQLDTLNIRAGE